MRAVSTRALALALAGCLLACHSAPTGDLQASSTGATSSGGGATTNRTPGAGGAVAAPPACTFTVAGSVNSAGISPEPISGFILGPNMFQCGTVANGGSDQLYVYLGQDVTLGLGSFPAPYPGSYLWEHCEAGTCFYYANDSSSYPAGGCSVDITLAPAMNAPGQPIAGTFACDSLFGGGNSPPSIAMTGSFSLVTEAVGAGGSSSGTGGAGGSSSGTGGADGGAPDFCSLTVGGRIDIPPSAAPGAPLSYGGNLSCSTSELGAEGWFSLDLSTVNGPGSYPSLGNADFNLSFCAPTAEGCTDDEYFVATASAGCSAEITAAPPGVPSDGDFIAGSFSCPGLPDEINPERSVSVSGSFAMVVQPPPQ